MPVGPASSCDLAAASLAGEFPALETCTSVVRLDYSTKKILGYRILCGPYASPDEAAARLVAGSDFAHAKSISGAKPADEWVFYNSAGDFGSAAAVNARGGLRVFSGTTIWDGRGELDDLSSFKSTSLGSGCASGTLPSARGFDLRSGGALDSTTTESVLGVVYDTALPKAALSRGYVFDAVVLLYPRSVGMFDPSSAEYIVLLNSGWLE